MDQTTAAMFFVAAVLIVGGILFAMISFSRNSPRSLKQDQYRSQWLTIESQLKRDDTHSYMVCIMNADKLLDKALRERCIKGQTMGERMKSYRGKWTNAQDVWSAHKVRNRLAHETDVVVSYDQARRALAAFRQALKDVGAL